MYLLFSNTFYNIKQANTIFVKKNRLIATVGTLLSRDRDFLNIFRTNFKKTYIFAFLTS